MYLRHNASIASTARTFHRNFAPFFNADPHLRGLGAVVTQQSGVSLAFITVRQSWVLLVVR
jgi:hypothetical protein